MIRRCRWLRCPTVPPAPPAAAKGSAAVAGAAAAAAAPSSGSPGQPEITLDAETKEKLRIVEQIGEQAFDENTEILKKIMLRGLRALVIGGFGFVAFAVAMKRQKRRQQEQAEEAEHLANGTKPEDPTERYLAEMRALGFDVDGLEDEIAEKNKKKKE